MGEMGARSSRAQMPSEQVTFEGWAVREFREQEISTRLRMKIGHLAAMVGVRLKYNLITVRNMLKIVVSCTIE